MRPRLCGDGVVLGVCCSTPSPTLDQLGFWLAAVASAVVVQDGEGRRARRRAAKIMLRALVHEFTADNVDGIFRRVRGA